MAQDLPESPFTVPTILESPENKGSLSVLSPFEPVKKISPTFPADPGQCPCREPGRVSPWEADLLLCPAHAREWLRSEEKVLAVTAIEYDDEVALRAAVDAFVKRIRKGPSLFQKIKRMINAWRAP